VKTLQALIGIVLVTILFFAVPGASAHRPGWGNDSGATQIDNLSTSLAFYRELKAPAQVDVYTFQGQAGEHLHAGISIPAISRLESYGVNMALMGPGLPEADHEALPADHPEGLGAIIIPNTPGKDFFEPFTLTSYWGRQRIEFNLPASGTYYLLVWNPSGATGKYVMDTGEAEVFSPGDLLRFPVWWVRVHAFFGQGMLMLASLLFFLGGIGTLFVLARRRAKLVNTNIRRNTA